MSSAFWSYAWSDSALLTEQWHIVVHRRTLDTALVENFDLDLGSVGEVLGIDRHNSRVLGMQALCQLDAQGEDYLATVATFLADHPHSGETLSYAHEVVERAWRDRETVEQEVVQHAQGWTMKRMSSVDRNVLRIALAEFDLGQVPPKVIINEAIEIAKEFGSAESGGFVNGILDRLWKGIAPRPTPEEPESSEVTEPDTGSAKPEVPEEPDVPEKPEVDEE